MHPLALIVVGALEQMNSYVLIYVGISGRTYKESTLAVGGLVRRRGREAGRKILDCALTYPSSSPTPFNLRLCAD